MIPRFEYLDQDLKKLLDMCDGGLDPATTKAHVCSTLFDVIFGKKRNTHTLTLVFSDSVTTLGRKVTEPHGERSENL